MTSYQTRSNAIILQGALPAYRNPEVVRLKTGEVFYEKAYMSPRPPPKISLRHDWARGEVQLGSAVDQQSEGDVVRQSFSLRTLFFSDAVHQETKMLDTDNEFLR